MKHLDLIGLMILSVCLLGMAGTAHAAQNDVIVPNIQGVTMEIAVRMLQSFGLQPRFQSTETLSAIVNWQDPRPGMSLPVGGEVFLSSAAAKITRTPVVTAIPRQPIPEQSVASFKIIGPTVRSSGTGVLVTPTQFTQPTQPIQTTQQTNRVITQSTSSTEGEATILYQPPKSAANKNLIAETKPRFYPAWYPRRFISQSVSQSATQTTKSQPQSARTQSQPQPVRTQPTVQNQSWTPSPVLPQQGYSPQSIDSATSVTIFSGSQPVVSVVPVPNLRRLSQADAISALNNTGLILGNVLLVQPTQERTGIVVDQSPSARTLVPVRTRVDLWVTN